MRNIIHYDGGLTLTLRVRSDLNFMAFEDYQLMVGSCFVVAHSYYKRFGNIVYRRCLTFYDSDFADSDRKLMTLLIDESLEIARLTLHYNYIRLNDQIDKRYRVLLRRAGFEIVEERLRRADIAIDCDVPFKRLAQLIESNKFSTRFNREKLKKFETSYTFGSIDNLQLCIYDKLEELARSRSPYAKLKDLQYVFDSENITRIEFRCCRLWLNRNGIRTLEEFEERFYQIVRYLTRYIFCLQDDCHKRGASYQLWCKITAKHCNKRVSRSSILISRIQQKKDDNNLKIAFSQLKSVMTRAEKLRRSSFSAQRIAVMLNKLCLEFKELSKYVRFDDGSAEPDSKRVFDSSGSLLDFPLRVSGFQFP